MLTREEANVFINRVSFIGGFSPNGIEELINIVNKITEKNKRDIQVGDIYLNTIGYPVQITGAVGNRFLGGGKNVYDKNGESENGVPDLDLSKAYELVEITDE